LRISARGSLEDSPVTDEPVYATFGFTDAEWGLLVGLPQSVLTAASAAAPDGARKTRAENAAGLDKISDGRGSADPLVAAVAAELVTRVGDPERGEELPVIEPGDPAGYVGDVLDRAATAAALLAGRPVAGDPGAYKHWLVEIAETVVGAASTGGVFGIGGDVVTETERRFCDDLSAVLTA
jgi:hypothetical protein